MKPLLPRIVAMLLLLTLAATVSSAQKKRAPRRAPAAKPVVAEPLTPGAAQASSDASQLVLANGALAMTWRIEGRRLFAASLQDKRNARAIAMDGPLFQLQFADGKTLSSNDLRLVAAPRPIMLVGDSGAPRLADRFDGKEFLAELEDEAKTVHVFWRAILRDGAGYVRQEINIQPISADLPAFVLRMSGARLPKPLSEGSPMGRPVFQDNVFLGYEDVYSICESQRGALACGISTHIPLGKGVMSPNYSSVIGVSAAGQLRREWSQYLLRERVHSFAPQLIVHLQSSAQDKSESAMADAIKNFGAEMSKRQASVAAYVIDDWQDSQKPLQPSATLFPNGFSALQKSSEDVQSELGFHVSIPAAVMVEKPAAKARKPQKPIVESVPFRFSNPNDFNMIRSAFLKLAKGSKASYLELAGPGSNEPPAAGSYVDSDYDAWRMLSAELRAQTPDLLVEYNSQLVLLQSSPWLLWSADAVSVNPSLMANGKQTRADVLMSGDLMLLSLLSPEPRQSYPIAATSTTVQLSPSAAISSLQSEVGFAENVRNSAAAMHGWLELDIAPNLLQEKDYDAIAESFQWLQSNAPLIADAHWVGGSPFAGDIYGVAAWTPAKAALMLRNPSATAKSFPLDLAKLFELPTGDKTKSYALRSPWRADKGGKMLLVKLGAPTSITLQPGESLLWEATPQLK